MSSDDLLDVAALPGVAEAVGRAREACTALRWHPGLRRRAAAARAESTAHAAWASAALDGAQLPLELVRDVLRGARGAPGDAVGKAVTGALRATVEASALGEVVRRSPLQALARLHTAAAAGIVPTASLGRPRTDSDELLDRLGEVAVREGTDLQAGLQRIAELMAAGAEVPALVVAALVHGELLVVRPFVAGNAVVARALFRAHIVERGLDPTGVALPEVALLHAGADAYAQSASAYAGGSAEGVGAWVRFCATALERGAAQGQAVADAVLAGRLPT